MGYNDDRQRERREDEIRRMVQMEREELRRKREQIEEQNRRAERQAQQYDSSPSPSRPRTTRVKVDNIDDGIRMLIFVGVFAVLGGIVAALLHVSLFWGVPLGSAVGLFYRHVFRYFV